MFYSGNMPLICGQFSNFHLQIIILYNDITKICHQYLLHFYQHTQNLQGNAIRVLKNRTYHVGREKTI